MSTSAPVSIAELVEQAMTLAHHPGRKPRSRSGFWAWYRRYLACEDWSTLRQRVLDRDGHLCRCGQTATQIHHLNYARIGHERLSDLVSICDACHAAEHGRRFPIPEIREERA